MIEMKGHIFVIDRGPHQITLRWNKTYHSRDWIKSDHKIWLIEPKNIIIRVRHNKPKTLSY